MVGEARERNHEYSAGKKNRSVCAGKAGRKPKVTRKLNRRKEVGGGKMTEYLKHFKEVISCLLSTVDKDVGKWGHIYIVGGNVKYFFRGLFGNSYP